MVSELSTQLTQEIEFRSICQVEIPGGGADLGGNHDEKCSVLASSDACGVLLVSASSGLHVIRIRDIERNGINVVEKGKAGSTVQFNAIASPSLGSRPSFIDISKDGGVVAIAVEGLGDAGLSVVSLHHMALLYKGNCEEPFCVRDFDSKVTALRIRPHPLESHSSQQQPEVLVVTKAGEAAVVRSSGPVESITRGDELSYTAGDWSPSGEMIALGCSNSCDLVVLNTSSLDTITLQTSKPIEAELSEGGHKRLDFVVWLNDNLLYTLYCSTEDSDGELIVTSSGVLWKISQGGSQAEPVKFDNGVCFPSFGVPSTTHHQFYLSAILKGEWKAAILASSVSADIPLLLEREGEWILAEPDEDYQITLPMTSDDQNTFPRGLAVSLNASISLPYSEDSDPPSPLAFVMNNEGLLKMYAFLDREKQSTQNKEVLQEPKAIPSPISMNRDDTCTIANVPTLTNVDESSITPDMATKQPTEKFSVFGTGSEPPSFNFGKPSTGAFSIVQSKPGFSFGGSSFSQSKTFSFDIAAAPPTTTAPSTSVEDTAINGTTTKPLTSSVFGGSSSLYSSAGKNMQEGSEVSFVSSGPTMSFGAAPTSSFMPKQSSSSSTVLEEITLKPLASSSGDQVGGGVKMEETKLPTLSFGSPSMKSKETNTPFGRALDHSSGETKDLTSKAAPISFGEKLDTAAVAKTSSKPSAVPSGSSGYPPMSSKAPTPFSASASSKADSKPSAVPSGSGGYPPMSSKAPTPFSTSASSKVGSKPSAVPSGSGGYPPMSSKAPTPFSTSASSKVDSKPSAAPAGSSGYPRMSSKAPTPFSASASSKADSKPSAVPSGSGGYPPMSSKAPTIFGEKPPAVTLITTKSESKPATTFDGDYPSTSSRTVAPSQAKGVVQSAREVEGLKPMSIYESNTWDIISNFDVVLQELRKWHGLLEDDWKEEFDKCVQAALDASESLRSDLCSLETSLQAGERDVNETKGNMAELKWQTVETSSILLEASSPNYLRLLETQELEKPAAELRDAISLSAAKLADTIVTLQQALALRVNLKEGDNAVQPEKLAHALVSFSQSQRQPASTVGRISFGGSAQKRLGFGYGAKPRRGSSDSLNPEKGPQLVRIGTYHRPNCTEDFSSGNRRPSQPSNMSTATRALLRIVNSTYQRSKDAEATWQDLKNTSAIVEEKLLSKRSGSITASNKGQEGKTNPMLQGGHGSATNSNNGNRYINNAQLTNHWKKKLLCLLMDEAGMCAADHVTEISSHACSSYSLPLLGSRSQGEVPATSVSDILKEKQRGVSLLLPSGTLSGLPKMPDLPMPIAPPRMAAQIPEERLVVRPAAASSAKPGKPTQKLGPSHSTFESSLLLKASSTPSTGRVVAIASPPEVSAASQVASQKGQIFGSSGAFSEGLSKLKGTTSTTRNNTASKTIPNAFSIPEASSTGTTRVTSLQDRDTYPPKVSSVKKVESIPKAVISSPQEQLVSESKTTTATAYEDEDSSLSTVFSSKTSVSKNLFQGSSSSTTTDAVFPSTNEVKLPSLTTSELKGGDTLGTLPSSPPPLDSLSSKPAATKKKDIEVTPIVKKSTVPAGFDNTPTKSLFGNLSVAAAPVTLSSSSSDLKKPIISDDASEQLATPTVTITPLPVEPLSNEVSKIHSEIVSIYEKHNPSRVGNVEQLLEKYKGNEQALLARIKKKYGIAVSDSSALNVPGTQQTQAATAAPSIPATTSVFGSALGSLGTSSVNQLATPSLFGVPKSGGGPSPAEGSIFGASASKAGGGGINPFGGGATTSAQQQQQIPSTFSSHSLAASNTTMAPFGAVTTPANTPSFPSFTTMNGTSSTFSEMLRQWMVSVYQKHDPSRASKVDSLLTKYSGREAEVVSRLVQKYNEYPPQQLQAELKSCQQQPPQAKPPQQGSFGGGNNSFSTGAGGDIFGTQQQRGFGVMPSSGFGTTPAFQPMAGSGVSAGFGSAALGTGSDVMGVKGQESSSGFGGSSLSKGQVGGFGSLTQQQPQSGAFGASSTFADVSKPPNKFTGANFMQMRG